MTSSIVRTVVVVVLGAALLTGCADGSAEPETPVATSAAPAAALPEPGAGCPENAAKGTSIRMTTPSGHSLAGVRLGSGTTAVVLAHQNNASLCQWLPYGQELAAKGYQVLAFDFVGFGSSTRSAPTYVEDVSTAAAEARKSGATKVVLMGASMGGTASISAAAAITPAVTAVVALSAPTVFDGVNAKKAAGNLTMPGLFTAGDADAGFAVSMREVEAVVPGELGTLLVVASYEHGVRLLDPTGQSSAEVRAAVDAFLAKNAPTT